MFLLGVVRPFETRTHRAEQTLVVCTEKGQDRNRVRDSESGRGREREGERGRGRGRGRERETDIYTDSVMYKGTLTGVFHD